MSNPHFSQTIAALEVAAKAPQWTENVALAAIQAQATLAVAYEMRTANMLAAYNGDVAKRVEGAAADQYPLHNGICDRLDIA